MQWVGMQRLLRELRLPHDAVMAVGDGGNDYELVMHCGLGVAMANAVPQVRT
jgi:hydroxymethylpyrimidine pyrophosphatase-like HAD family hydrolase